MTAGHDFYIPSHLIEKIVCCRYVSSKLKETGKIGSHVLLASPRLMPVAFAMGALIRVVMNVQPFPKDKRLFVRNTIERRCAWRSAVVGLVLMGNPVAGQWMKMVQHGEAAPADLPGVAPDAQLAFYLGKRQPVLAANGRVAFQANLYESGTSQTDDISLWHGFPGLEMNLVSRVNTGNASGLNQPIKSFVGIPLQATSGGQTAFAAKIADPTPFNPNNVEIGIWADRLPVSGHHSLISISGQPAPGLPGWDIASIYLPMALSSEGSVLFLALVTDNQGGGKRVIYRARVTTGVSPMVVADTPGVVEGLDPEVSFQIFKLDHLRTSADGSVVFWGALQGPGIADSNRSGLFHAAGQSVVQVKPVVRAGDPAGGTGDHFSVFGLPSRAGSWVAFSASLVNGEHGRNDGVFRMQIGSSAEAIALRGQTAPHTGGQIFFDFGSPEIDHAGHIAFRAIISPDGTINNNTEALFSTLNGLRPMAIRGEEAPGLSGDPAPKFGDLDRVVIAPRGGHIAFEAEFGSSGNGVWVVNGEGAVHLLAATGETIPDLGSVSAVTLYDGSDDEVNTVGEGGRNGADGRPSPLNENHQLALQLGINGVSTVCVVNMGPPFLAHKGFDPQTGNPQVLYPANADTSYRIDITGDFQQWAPLAEGIPGQGAVQSLEADPGPMRVFGLRLVEE